MSTFDLYLILSGFLPKIDNFFTLNANIQIMDFYATKA